MEHPRLAEQTAQDPGEGREDGDAASLRDDAVSRGYTAVMSLDVPLIRRALALAGRAPSAHNTQPWRVTVTSDRVVVTVDPARHLAHGDPMERDLRLAMGAFCEALRIAVRAEGRELRATLLPDGAFAAYADGGLATPEVRVEASSLAGLLARRVSSRLHYGPRMLDAEQRAELDTVASRHGLTLHVGGQGSRAATAWIDLLRASIRETWLDVRSTSELGAWLRFRPRGEASEDGLDVRCMGLSRSETVALAAVAQPRLWQALGRVFLAPSLAATLAEDELRHVREAPQVCVVTCAGDARETGAGLLHLWLAFTRLGLHVHPYSALLDRRGWELAALLGVDTRQLVFCGRLGVSEGAPVRSGRLPVDRFTTGA